VVLLAMISEGLEQPYLRAALIVFVLRCMTVDVTDDGVGGADTEKGTGLRGLADRVEAVDGRLRVWTPVGGGTRVRAEIPCGEPSPRTASCSARGSAVC